MRFCRALPVGFVALFGLLVTGCDSGIVGQADEGLAPESGRSIYDGPVPTTQARRLTPKGGASEATIQSSHEVFIDFDDLTPFGMVTTQYSAEGVLFSGDALVVTGPPTHSGANTVTGTSGSGAIVLSFSPSVESVSAWLGGSCTAQLECFDASNVSLGSEVRSCVAAYDLVSVTAVGIVSCEISDSNGEANTLLFDDLTFTPSEDEVLEVLVDVKPGGDENPINLGAGGKIPVAILTTPDFDAATVDVASVMVVDSDGAGAPVNQKKNGSYQASLSDVDGDGDQDLVLHFEQPVLEANGVLDVDTTELILTGQTTGGEAFEGGDTVTLTPSS